ncbi:MAG: 4Fe-4S binding protein [Candidatus Zixiibacteriota bacterium]
MLKIDLTTCLTCAGCMSLCPEGALFHDVEHLKVLHDDCTLCRICVKFCPVEALSIDHDTGFLDEVA